MALTKADLVRSVAKHTRFRQKGRQGQQYLFPEMDFKKMPLSRASEIVGSLFEIIKGSLEKGDTVVMPQIGKLKVRFKWARKGRNPVTGETIIIESRRVVTFRSSVKLREKINSGDDP